jgi:hypothetical protein
VAALLAARPLHDSLGIVPLSAAELLSVALLAALPFAALLSFKAWWDSSDP